MSHSLGEVGVSCCFELDTLLWSLSPSLLKSQQLLRSLSFPSQTPPDVISQATRAQHTTSSPDLHLCLFLSSSFPFPPSLPSSSFLQWRSAMSLENNKTASSNVLEERVCEPPQRWVKSRNSSDIAEKRNKKRVVMESREVEVPRNKMKPSIDDSNGEVGNQPSAGALWDIFRREDAGKLRDYPAKHSREFKHNKCRPVEQVIHPIHDQCFYLTTEHKRQLNEEYGIEPWAFVQKLGEAVFVSAGCPHQSCSCIKLALDFVSPENVHECVKLTEEFRLLPVKHRVNEDKLEVKKMALHALNQAILDITRYDLNQRSRSESETEDKIVKREIEKPEDQT